MRLYSLALFACIILCAFKISSDILEDLGTTLKEVKQATIQQLDNEHFSMPYYNGKIQAACKKLPVGVREATMLSLGKIIKDYVSSPECKTDYENHLKEMYFKEPYNPNDPKWEEIKKNKTENVLSGYSNATDETLKYLAQGLDIEITTYESFHKLIQETPEMEIPGMSKETCEKTIAQDKALKTLYDSDKKSFLQKYAETQGMREKDAEIAKAKSDYEQGKINFESKKDYSERLKSQLQDFLSVTSDINFSATLKDGNYGRKIFADPSLESKSGEWKFYFRCGKEAVGGARKFAQQWLESLK